jgi:4-amino-4-deoxy-L-arabinose transferase-like glycosyltransferase
VFIIVIGFSLRFWQLSNTPLVNRDELAIGYNAYSILQTGRDEHGVFMPLTFRSFGDYKLPGLIYTSVIPVHLFGRSIFSIRFINALTGTLTLIIFYWLLRQLGKNKLFSLMAVTLLAVSPWHIHSSRSAYEPLVGLFWSMLSYVFLIKSRTNFKTMIGFLICSVMGAFYYNAVFLLAPTVYGLFLFVFHFSHGTIQKKHGYLIGLLVILLLGYWWVFQDINASRIHTTIFSRASVENIMVSLSRNIAKDRLPTTVVRLFQLPIGYQVHQLLRGYVSSFNPIYIWFDGGNNPWHNLSFIGLGNMYLLTFPLFLLGLRMVIRQIPKRQFADLFFLGLLLLSPLSNAITIDAPNTNRLMDFHVAITYFSICGLFWIFTHYHWRWTIAVFWIFVLSSLFFVTTYFSALKDDNHPLWNASLPTMVDRVNSVRSLYPIIYYTSPSEYSYIYNAFFSPFDPEDFQKNAVWITKGMEQVSAYRQFRFESFTPLACYRILHITPAKLGDNEEDTVILIRNRFGEPTWKAMDLSL